MSENIAQVPDGVLIKDGEPIVVIRPKDPKAALALVQDIVDRQRLGKITPQRATREFQQVPCKQPYQFVGFLRADEAKIVNTNGMPDQPLQEGDSFISLSQLAKFRNLSAEQRNSARNN